MSQAAGLTDTGSAHGCFSPTPTSGSPNISNGLPAARGDSVFAVCSCPLEGYIAMNTMEIVK